MLSTIKTFTKDKKNQIISYRRRVVDATLARAEGYAGGIEVATTQLTSKIQKLTESLNEQASDNLRMGDKLRREHEHREDKLRISYEERVDILEKRHTKNCKECMETTEMERERLRNNQNSLLNLIQSINMTYMKLFKHSSLIADEHDSIIKSSGRVKASRDMLLMIRKEIDDLVKKALPTLDITETETGQPLSIDHNIDKLK